MEELIENYKLSQFEHKKVLELLKKNLFKDKMPENNPSILFVVGQPGCGKTTFIESLNLSPYVVINSDEYRSYHIRSKEILEKYPTDYAKLTNFDAHLWGDELFLHAIQNGYSVLREKAPTDYSLVELIKTIPPHYAIFVDVVVTGNLQSLLATRERYEKEILECTNAKLSNMEAHNKCYDLLANFISKCLSLEVKVNFIVPGNNQFKTISVQEDDLDLFQKIRQESNAKACLNFEKRMENIKKSMTKRNAGDEQFSELKKIESIYCATRNSVKDTNPLVDKEIQK